MADTSPTTPATRTRTRRKTAATDRSTAAKKAAATRARNQATAARKRSTTAKKAAATRRDLQRTPVERYVDYAGRVVTIQVGAALTARDTVVSAVEASRETVERELLARRRRVEQDLRRFERRGETARTRVERDLRGVRRDAGAQAGLVGARVENLVQTGHHRRHAGRLEGDRARCAGHLAAARAPLPRPGPETRSAVRLPASYLAGRAVPLLPRTGRPRAARSSVRPPPPRAAQPVCQNGSMPTRDEILQALTAVIDPELRRSIVELEMVRSIDARADGTVAVTVSLTTPGCPIRSHFENAVRSAVGGLQGVTRVEVAFDVLSDQEKSGLQQKLGRGALPEGALAQVANVVCVGSGKGGVGKSTITANLAAALASQGKKVGVLDADVWGYSIPRMFGLGGRPQVSPERKILPLEAGGVKVMSIGFFVEEDSAVVWRGPMLHKALTQFLEDVEWGELDFLLVDLPPGTGDVSMTLAQLLPQSKFLLVTTPQPVAQKVARRAAEMAHKVNLEIGGVVENMAGFVTPGGERYAIFGEGGGQALADELDVPLLGKVPLTMPLREQADGGVPLVVTDPDDPAAQAIAQTARGLVAMFPLELPILQMATVGGSGDGPGERPPAGISLPMAG